MAENLKVVWHNGMSVDKIHFEQLTRYLERDINLKTINSLSNFYGVLDIEISKELLEQGKVGLKSILAIAQDGTIYDAPNEDELPEPFEINFSSFNSSIIVLKIPLNHPVADISLKNDIADSKFRAVRANIKSKVYENSKMDEFDEFDVGLDNALDQDSQSIILASLKTKLAVLGDKTPYELEIPICKVQGVLQSGQIKLDDKFIPTCIDISKFEFIRQFLGQMLHSINQHKSVLEDVFKSIDQTKNTLDFSTYLTLNMLKKYHFIFSILLNKDKIHPEFLHEQRTMFQADLVALSSEFNSDEYVPYNHNDLTSVFIKLTNSIRVLFSRILSPKYSMAKITKNAHGFFDCIFDNAEIIRNSELYLAISTDDGVNFIMQNFKSQCKIHTQSQIKNIVASQLNGINIDQISLIPSALPHLNGYVYYRLDKTNLPFGENTISIYITNSFKNPDIKLWALF